MIDPYQGDPKIILTENGATLKFVGGQPVMDRGLENFALISLLTKTGWAGNFFIRAEADKIGSDFEEAALNTRTEAAHISAPVPSPSINGMVGLFGTNNFPSSIFIFPEFISIYFFKLLLHHYLL